MSKDKIDVKIVPKEEALWEEVLKGAETELANTEEVYFKNIHFNKGVIRMAKARLKELENESKA